MNKDKFLHQQRRRRRLRVRKTVRGTASKPRLCVVRTHRHISCQVIDDVARATLVSASTCEKALRDTVPYGGNKTAAQAIGKTLAERALAAGVTAVCLDRGSSRYHGRVAALADAAREAGLRF